MTLLDTSRPATTVNVDYTDFTEGTGIKVFYGTHSKQTTNDTYLLTGSTLYSNDIQTKSGNYAGNGAAAQQLDLDFDTAPFNLPKNMKGTAYISVPIRAQQIGGTCDEIYIIAKLRKVTNSTEIEIASAQSETYTNVDGNKLPLVKITVPLTHFKKGETLRLTIEAWMKDVTGGNVRNMWIAHDPKARVTTEFPGTDNVPTQLIAHIPFRIGF